MIFLTTFDRTWGRFLSYRCTHTTAKAYIRWPQPLGPPIKLKVYCHHAEVRVLNFFFFETVSDFGNKAKPWANSIKTTLPLQNSHLAEHGIVALMLSNYKSDDIALHRVDLYLILFHFFFFFFKNAL